MDPSFESLLHRLAHLSDQFRELKEGVQKAIRIADEDPEMALTRARKVLEHVIREVYERRCQEPPGTRPLENLLQRLVKDGHFPDRLDAYANTIRKLGNVGTHTFGEKITAADVYQSLSQLMPILEWYFETERPEAMGQQPVQTQPPKPAKFKSSDQSPAPPPQTKLAIVPKGLRSFDAKDADFFLDLLPGPRDKNGLPENIRFWKHRIEEKDEPTFTVGVIYGPSGCGKSSLVKAGVLPRLAKGILSVYVEATAADTEAKLLKSLRNRCPNLPGDLDLTGTMAALRQNEDQKVIIILDQFEQWLHGKRGEENTELAQALRQCDGKHVQCVVLVRDDFWMGLTRFMQELQIEIVPGQNTAVVDLFDLRHAKKVLAAFGQAFGALPELLGKEQESFLEQAVHGLAQEGRVISVRLALFAEIVKGKAWTPATLKEVGGMEGVGVTFLEETFSSSVASPKNRLHQKAARSVLKSLLPEQGTDIKGNMRSHDELLEASGYSSRPKDFVELLKILDNEVRLITPTDPGKMDSEVSQGPATPGEKYYQLTHDYLVHSLREWLTRKQKESRRGRAEIRLAERAASWNAKPESRHLPAWWEWFNIRLFTRKGDWTPSQQKMMRKATRYHAVRGLGLAMLLLSITLVGLSIRGQVIEQNRATYAAGLVRQLLDAEIAQVPGIILQMEAYRRWTDPLLKEAYDKAETHHDSRKQLHASLALLPVDPSQVGYLYGRMLDAEPQEVTVLRDALLAHKDELIERLWTIVDQPQKGRESQRLRAACALATFDPNNARWDKASGPVVEQLVSVSPVFLATWMDGLRPVSSKLVGPLSSIFQDREIERTGERTLATSILADYAADQPDVMTDLLMVADEKQFAVVFPKLETHRERAIDLLEQELGKQNTQMATDEEKERLAKRQANAAVALLRLDRAQLVWPQLKHRPDPRVRSYLIHRLCGLGADPRAILHRLDEEQEVSIRRALLLSLGEFGPEQLLPGERDPFVSKVIRLYRDDPDPGLHGAAEWLLRQWKREESFKEIDKELATGKVEGQRQWYINGQDQTMVVIQGPVEFLMGSPSTEAGREGGAEGRVEMQHKMRIDRSFAIAAKEVTVEQFLRFRKDHDYHKQYAPRGDCPVNDVSWYDAAAYCNWLSQQEGILEDQWSYLPNAHGEYAKGMKLALDYLHRTGYRLPSEAEWEYACRAGTMTSRYYGETEELLGKYSWYTKNSLDRWMLAGGSLKPNDLGLFDLLGNALEWCQERMTNDSAELDDQDTKKEVEGDEFRVLRGGSLFYQGVDVRSADRIRNQPSYHNFDVGFRPVRTFR